MHIKFFEFVHADLKNAIFDAKLNADSEFEVKKLCLPTHLRKKNVWKFAVADSKNFYSTEFKLRFYSKYTDMSHNHESRALESLIF